MSILYLSLGFSSVIYDGERVLWRVLEENSTPLVFRGGEEVHSDLDGMDIYSFYCQPPKM
jgi:hypothetical protein